MGALQTGFTESFRKYGVFFNHIAVVPAEQIAGYPALKAIFPLEKVRFR